MVMALTGSDKGASVKGSGLGEKELGKSLPCMAEDENISRGFSVGKDSCICRTADGHASKLLADGANWKAPIYHLR